MHPTAVGTAPGRVNLIGEHTDYNEGLSLPFALPLTTTARLIRRADREVHVVSRDLDRTWTGRLDDLAPGAVTGWAAYVGGVLWALRQAGWDVPGVDVEVRSTVPLGAGLSSSAALECAVAVAVAGLLGRDLDPLLRTDLAALCQRAETEFVGAPTGGLDQLASLLTPADHALLIDFSDRSTRPVRLRLAAAGLSVLVTDTRVAHALADEAGGYAARRAECERAAAALGVPSLRQAGPEDPDRLDDPALRARARHVVTENDRVEESVALVHAEDWPALGRVLTASHRSLRDDFAVSCPELDTAVDGALGAGALGARMTGGGFGGSSIALVEDRRVDAVRRAVDGAFAREGWTAPEHHVVRPAGCATVTN